MSKGHTESELRTSRWHLCKLFVESLDSLLEHGPMRRAGGLGQIV